MDQSNRAIYGPKNPKKITNSLIFISNFILMNFCDDLTARTYSMFSLLSFINFPIYFTPFSTGDYISESWCSFNLINSSSSAATAAIKHHTLR